MKTRFGDQPLLGVMKAQRWSFAALAPEINTTYGQLYNAAHGVTVPSPQLRDQLPKILDVPLTSLFTARVLAQSFNRRGPKPKPQGRAA